MGLIGQRVEVEKASEVIYSIFVEEQEVFGCGMTPPLLVF